jgi:hypothetical protein
MRSEPFISLPSRAEEADHDEDVNVAVKTSTIVTFSSSLGKEEPTLYF